MIKEEGLRPRPAYQLELLRLGRLSMEVGGRGSWQRFAEAVAAQLAGQVAGKAVLVVD